MVEQPLNKQVEQQKETSATARRRFPPTPRLPSPSSTPATYTVALELVSEALDGLRNHARAGRIGCAQGAGAAPPRFRISAPRPTEGPARPATSPAIAHRCSIMRRTRSGRADRRSIWEPLGASSSGGRLVHCGCDA